MDTTSFGIAIMAAGKGTRLKSKRAKVLHEIGGRPLLLHVIAAAETIAPPERIFCIIGHHADSVRTVAVSTGVTFVTQAEQRGTGHALQMLKRYLTFNELAPSSPATSPSSAPKPSSRCVPSIWSNTRP
jgi:bifunctional UDP-N-acetylglucosamine pyrophosphorylase/glucosamine-1-phosphate N-acetyltransferase